MRDIRGAEPTPKTDERLDPRLIAVLDDMRRVIVAHNELRSIVRTARPPLRDWPFIRGGALRKTLLARIDNVLAPRSRT